MKITRGYACVGLVNPKSDVNIGSAMRACGVYGASHLLYTGRRFRGSKKFITDPAKFHRHIPLMHYNDIHDAIPNGCVPVAVDIIDGAKSLIKYTHPERAFYIFGPEDGTLGKSVTDFCRDIVYVPTNGCMNLAASVNVVLYDRMMKRSQEER